MGLGCWLLLLVPLKKAWREVWWALDFCCDWIGEVVVGRLAQDEVGDGIPPC